MSDMKNKIPTIKESDSNFGQIEDVNVKVRVELGRAKVQIKDILKISVGDILELTKFAGDSLDIYVEDKLIGRGECVVINDKFGIRLTEVLGPEGRRVA